MEIILKNATEIGESGKDLDPSIFNSAAEEEEPAVITLSELSSIENFQKITTQVKVLSKMETMVVSGGKRKRDVVVGDSTGTSKVTLWEEHVDAMDVETRYRLEKFVVREYASQKYLSMSRSGSVIVVIDDIGDVETVTYGTSAVTICNPEIIGVPQLDIYKACFEVQSES